MNVGIVAHWFNRGQATVARQLRTLFDGLGHTTHILARPTPGGFHRPDFVSREDVWEQQGVTAAEGYAISQATYLRWAREAALDVAFFDQNYQFDEIAALRAAGVRTVGRFVWESFSAEHAADARRAFSTIYSLTRAEQQRYGELGIESPYVQWGCHPELLAVPHGEAQREPPPPVRYLYVGGYLSLRKPTGAVLAAFAPLASPAVALTVKSQLRLRYADYRVPRTLAEATPRIRHWVRYPAVAWRRFPRMRFDARDLPLEAYYRLFAAHHVAVAPSRWEGLGLHLFEALAFGMPLISTNIPPINEVFTDRLDARLVKAHVIGRAPSGLPAYEPDPDDLRAALRELSDPRVLEGYARNVCATRERRAWGETVAGYERLLSA